MCHSSGSRRRGRGRQRRRPAGSEARKRAGESGSRGGRTDCVDARRCAFALYLLSGRKTTQQRREGGEKAVGPKRIQSRVAAALTGMKARLGVSPRMSKSQGNLYKRLLKFVKGICVLSCFSLTPRDKPFLKRSSLRLTGAVHCRKANASQERLLIQ